MAELSQDTRIGELTTPLGSDKLVVVRMNGTEGINELFEFEVESISKDSNINFDSAIGMNCTLRLNTIYGRTRFFDGILVSTESHDTDDGAFAYTLTLRPWLWMLSKRSNMLIFHEKTAPDIISEVFSEHGFAKFENLLTKSYPKLEYTVQYRESDLAFVLRLMELHGISYYFKHAKGEHTLILCDSISAYETVPGETRPYYPLREQNRRDEEHIHNWIPERQFTTGKTTFKDYDFKKPNSNMIAEKSRNAAYSNSSLESYDYPAKYVEQSVGSQYAEASMDMVNSNDNQFMASGDCMELASGQLVTLQKHPTKSFNKEYLILRCSHTFTAESYISGAGEQGADTYGGSYMLILSETPIAPPPVTPRPIVQGPQTAKVVGKGEIDVDEHGRILVQFHWDRKGDKSMRCRLAQVWAGNKWGGIFIPRIDMEVIVEFLEGDPDKPIVIGAVYNGNNKPPFDLPAKKNINGWKSNSTKGGSGYNELMFDDTKGNELFRTHAQYDMESKVLHDERKEVNNNRSTDVNNNDTLNVGKVLYVEAGEKITLKVGASSIVMDGSSITIKSPNIEIKAGQNYKSSAGITSEHKAGALMDIKGSLVKINT